MDSEYGSDFITVTDDDGNEFELEHLDTIEMDNELYMAFLPADMDENDPDFGMIILKVLKEDGEELFGSVDDDKELDRVYEAFMDQLYPEDEDEGGDAPEAEGFE